jgi:hypothetical protein
MIAGWIWDFLGILAALKLEVDFEQLFAVVM